MELKLISIFESEIRYFIYGTGSKSQLHHVPEKYVEKNTVSKVYMVFTSSFFSVLQGTLC